MEADETKNVFDQIFDRISHKLNQPGNEEIIEELNQIQRLIRQGILYNQQEDKRPLYNQFTFPLFWTAGVLSVYTCDIVMSQLPFKAKWIRLNRLAMRFQTDNTQPGAFPQRVPNIVWRSGDAGISGIDNVLYGRNLYPVPMNLVGTGKNMIQNGCCETAWANWSAIEDLSSYGITTIFKPFYIPSIWLRSSINDTIQLTVINASAGDTMTMNATFDFIE